MLKFMVVIRKRQDMSDAEFQNYLENTHGPLAKSFPVFADTFRTSRRKMPNGIVPHGTQLLNFILTIARAWKPRGHRRKGPRPTPTCLCLSILPTPRGRLSKN